MVTKPLKTMENENENLNSPNEETDGQEAETDIEDVTVLKEKIEELSGKNRQLFERAKKAEGFEFKDSHWIKKEKSEPSAPEPQSNEPDYAKLAFLKGENVVHPDDQKIVMDEAARLKLPLTDILQMAHIKSQLETNKDQRESQAGMPKGKGSAGGKTQADVDFWINQKNPDGTFKTPEDPELAAKVIDARIKKETTGNKFSEDLFTG